MTREEMIENTQLLKQEVNECPCFLILVLKFTQQKLLPTAS